MVQTGIDQATGPSPTLEEILNQQMKILAPRKTAYPDPDLPVTFTSMTQGNMGLGVIANIAFALAPMFQY